MTPGQRYLMLLKIDYEVLIRDAYSDIQYVNYMIETYAYTEGEYASYMRRIKEHELDIEYFSKKLKELGGAENGPSPTESNSESPKPGFQGITCTTVL